MATVGRLVVRLTATTGDLQKGLKRAERMMQRSSGRMRNIGSNMTSGFSLPLAAAGGAALKFSTNINEGMANVGTLIPGNIKRLQELKGEVQSLMGETGKGAKDLTGGLYEVISAFGDSAETAQRLAISAKASVAGVASTKDSIALLSATTKGYGDTSAAALQKASDLAFQTVKLGQTDFPQLAASIGTVIPNAAKLGVKQEELFATYATLTGVTGDAARVSTQYSSILRAMMSPTDAMAAGIKKLGFQTAEAMIAEHGLTGSLRLLVAQTDGTSAGVAKLFGRAEALTAAFALTGSQSAVFDEKLKLMASSAGATDAAFKAQTEGINVLGFAWKRLKANAEVAFQVMGDAIGPVILEVTNSGKPLVNVLKAAANWFKNLSSGGKRTVVVVAAFTAALGPALMALGLFGQGLATIPALLSPVVGLLGGTTKGVIQLGTALAHPRQGLEKLGKAATKFGKTITTQVLPKLAAISWQVWAVIGVALIMIGVWKKWGGEIKKWVVQAYKDSKKWVVEGWVQIGNWVKGALESVAGFFTGLYEAVATRVYEVYAAAKKWLVERLGDVFEWIRNAVGTVIGFFSGLYRNVAGWMGKTIDELKLDEALDGVNAFAKDAGLKLKEFGEGAAGVTRDAIVGIGEGLAEVARELPGAAGDFLKDLVAQVKAYMGQMWGEVEQAPVETMKKMAEAYGVLAAFGPSSRVTKGVQEVKKEFAGLGTVIQKHFGDDFSNILQGWKDNFTSTVTDMVMTGKSSFRDLINSIESDFLSMFVRNQITKPLFEAIFPGAAAEVAHGGGIVGGGGLGSRMVPAMAFAGAPRFHGGGMIGRNEVPIIARRGEGVFTPAQMRAMGGPLQVIINNHTPAQVQAQEYSSAGGARTLEITVHNIVNGGFDSGRYDSSLRRFGVYPQGSSR